LQVGLPALVGNREDVVETAVAGRAKRAHRNMLENLDLFAALVLVVQVAGLNDTNTALGAQIFVYARLAHAVIYLIGIPWLRTAAWGISAVGLVMVALPIFAA
ncbi:MAG: MAPEG family protein, partial [Alphaproteobacteria bacterium]|nr:MAPEG family protein [Alphaproteobacteria bacterium]